MEITNYTIYDKHITEEAKRLTDGEIEARQKAQAVLMNEDAFAIIYDGNGKSEFIYPRYFDGRNATHLHALAIAELMRILTCTGCTRIFLGLDNDNSCDDNGEETLEHRGTTH